ncbi:peptidyl-prolyl cis-trans isomerase [Peribacillus frigoritolerans]|uniref:peptidyl-prolyl cis-trans isomerase n=1 Tax=Peribacillus frigoritolerans TaxID=450367 RepID=UPI00105AA7E6|nr:peptidyl-prolyl cis-trans isomerase [Peribacillus frigoritolerans]TDL80014.1 peptidyl-prolyl cis-trans isomerase [Peribacillus frigoritolerans]
MDSIILIKGNIAFPITLDPGVWIFDERKVDLTVYFDENKKERNELEEYTKAVSKHWDQEIREGAKLPENKNNKRTEKERILNGTFGIPFLPFLKNAEPAQTAKYAVFKTGQGDVRMSLEEASALILGFSKNGKPLTDEGPVALYYGDGSNRNNPITNIKEIIIE